MSERARDLGAAVIAAGVQREATPGMPQDGPYPATTQEVGENFRDFAKADGFVVVDLRNEETLKLIRRATFDPGAFAKREIHTDGLPDELHVWQAKAVLAAIAGAS